MPEVKQGDVVRISYVGRLEDGTEFESCDESDPLQIRVGDGEFLKPLEDGLIGMQPGETKTIEMGQVYGAKDESRIFEYDRKRLPGGLDISVGRELQMHRADGKPVQVRIVGLSETTVTMDSNHPLAGRNLTYDVKVLEIA